MPRKIRELRSQLRKAGLILTPGKGSHGNWSHPNLEEPFTISGNDGDDAKPYQEKLVRAALRQVGDRQR